VYVMHIYMRIYFNNYLLCDCSVHYICRYRAR